MKKLFYMLMIMVAATANAQERKNHNNGAVMNGNGHSTTVVEAGRGHVDAPAQQMNYGYTQGVPPQGMPMMIMPMGKDEVKMVVDLLKKTTFDDDRLKVAQVCLALRPMMAKDIVTCSKVFTFDSAKKNFLMMAYPYCADKMNAGLLEKQLTFMSDRDEFRKMVMRYEKQMGGKPNHHKK